LRASPYITDPQSAGAAGGMVLPMSMFDVPRLMAAVKAGLIEGIPPLDDPTDAQLIATVVAHGMPRWSADQMRYHPGLRLQYYLFWMDVKRAAGGESEAKGRVDGAIAAWAQMRKDELISDHPNMSVGMWER
jgi:hypothetical protein